MDGRSRRVAPLVMAAWLIAGASGAEVLRLAVLDCRTGDCFPWSKLDGLAGGGGSVGAGVVVADAGAPAGISR